MRCLECGRPNALGGIRALTSYAILCEFRHNGFVEPITEIAEELQDGNGNVTVIGVTEAGTEIRRTGQAARIPHNNTAVAAASELIRILNI